METFLDIDQTRVVKAKDPRILVVAASGSGKTGTLTERAKYLVRQGINPRSIVAITFTNLAAGEMKERLGKLGEGMFIGTIHSYANYLLSFAGIYTDHIIKEENFDLLLEMVVNNPKVVLPIEHLLVDEFQDVNKLQATLITRTLNAKNIFLIADDWQAIFGFQGGDVEAMLELTKSPFWTVYTLPNNYRSGKDIVQFAMGFLNKVKNKIPKEIVCKNPYPGSVITYPYNDYDFIVDHILNDGFTEYKDWLVLTRSNVQVDEMRWKLEAAGVPTDTFKKKDLTNEQLHLRLAENTVKVLTAHSSKGLEAPHVAVLGIVPYNDDERKLAYVAATRAQETLIWCYNRRDKTKGLRPHHQRRTSKREKLMF